MIRLKVTKNFTYGPYVHACRTILTPQEHSSFEQVGVNGSVTFCPVLIEHVGVYIVGGYAVGVYLHGRNFHGNFFVRFHSYFRDFSKIANFATI